MRHLWKNMKKTYSGTLYGKNMWAADKFNFFMRNIEEKDPKALEWLDENHPYIWSRSKFSEDCKVDYINKNLSESFNSWVSKIKEHQIVEIHDKIRQMIIEKFVLRSKSARKMTGKIIPTIIKDLNAQSKATKDHDVLIYGPKKQKSQSTDLGMQLTWN
jgi:hypothetical protein